MIRKKKGRVKNSALFELIDFYLRDFLRAKPPKPSSKNVAGLSADSFAAVVLLRMLEAAVCFSD